MILIIFSDREEDIKGGLDSGYSNFIFACWTLYLPLSVCRSGSPSVLLTRYGQYKSDCDWSFTREIALAIRVET